MQLVVPSAVAIAVAIDAINWATNIPCLGIKVTSATSGLRETIRMTFQFLDEFTDLVKFTSNAYVLWTMGLALMATNTVIRLTLWRYYAV